MQQKVARALAGAALSFFASICQAYGEEGHSIVAEIAQRRLNPAAQQAVASLLHGGSLASVSSWADGVKFKGGLHPESYNWHFVDIPLWETTYDPEHVCVDKAKGDCVVKELDRLRTQLTTAPTADQRLEALMFAVHFVGDIHQPLHTVFEKTDANDQLVTGTVFHGATCGTDGCVFHSKPPKDNAMNLHYVWDTGLIRASYYDWGSYVDALEKGILKNDAEVQRLGQVVDPRQWAEETHLVAEQAWPAKGTDLTDNTVVFTVDDAYYDRVMPLLDRRLAVAGLRLAAFLNQAYASGPQQIVPKTNLGELKKELKGYYATKDANGVTRYELEQAQVAKEATDYLLARLADHPVAKPAMVLDIDETSLNNLQQLQADDYGYIPKGPCSLKAGYACASESWDHRKKATAISATLSLYKAAIDNHVAVFFVTGRPEQKTERADTKTNLERPGSSASMGSTCGRLATQAAHRLRNTSRRVVPPSRQMDTPFCST